MTAGRCLLIDAGNTRIKWALWDAATDGQSARSTQDGADSGDSPGSMHRASPPSDAGKGFCWLARGFCPTDRVGELAARLGELPAADREPAVKLALYCSVAGAEVNAAIEAQLGQLVASPGGVVRRFVARAKIGPLANAYANPAQLGADRLAAALGAWMRTRGDALVVGAGTATTVDVLRRVDENAARFAGGIILPGIDLMLNALARHTAQLPRATGSWRALPDNTDDAITSGCLQAEAGAIERMRRLLPEGTPCLLAGGAAEALLPLVAAPVIHAPDLVLEGLAAAILHRF